MKALLEDMYCNLTPKGVYYFIQLPADALFSKLVAFLFSVNHSISINESSLHEKLNVDSETLTELLDEALSEGWLKLEKTKLSIVDIEIDTLLQALTQEGKSVLMDKQGFTICSTGFFEKDVELLAAMGTEMLDAYQKYRTFLPEQELTSPAWGVLDVHGNANFGVWKLQVAENEFNLLIYGLPLFTQSAFVKLIWLLHYRYYQR